jgi:hypothetical protein
VNNLTGTCQLPREGGSHSIYVNRKARRTSSVPRHHEINNDLARKICKGPRGAMSGLIQSSRMALEFVTCRSRRHASRIRTLTDNRSS